MSHIFGNSTNGARWEPSPLHRGTFDILTTCIITISLCVWTAVHLNIPARDAEWAHTKRKIYWLFLALLAPEYVVFTAWFQWRQAFHIANEVRKHYGDDPLRPWWEKMLPWSICSVRRREGSVGSAELGAAKRYSSSGASVSSTDCDERPAVVSVPTSISGMEYRHSWTMKHGFFAAMGGFGFDIQVNDKAWLQLPRYDGNVFTSEGISLLLQHNEKSVLDVSTEEIDDKSKSNAMGKTIVCLQVSWFFAQCLSRWILSTPISLLELSTFAHGICAIIMMLFWWDKPFDVEHSIRIPLSDSGPGSLFWQMIKLWNKEGDIEIDFTSRTISLLTPRACNLETEARDDGRSEQDCVGDGDKVHRSGFRVALHMNDQGHRITLNDADHEFIENALAAHDNDSGFNSTWTYRLNWSLARPRLEQRPNVCLRNEHHRRIVLFGRIIAALALSGILYGGLHLLAWKAPFHTSSEQILWRASACFIIGLPMVFGLMAVMSKTSGGNLSRIFKPLFNALFIAWEGLTRRETSLITMDLYPVFVPATTGPWKKLVYWISIMLAYVIAMTYVAARIYLLVACFISLAYPPVGILEVPDWSVYFPHIS